jgi:hypothetical protein
MENNENIAPGGVERRKHDSAIDVTSEKDRATIRNACRRWPKRVKGIDEERKQGWLDDLAMVRDAARKTMEKGGEFYPVGDGGRWETRLDAANVITSAVKTEFAMETMNQADEHREAQIESGDGRSSGVTINAATVNVEALQRVASDPRAYAEFVRLSESVRSRDAAEPG